MTILPLLFAAPLCAFSVQEPEPAAQQGPVAAAEAAMPARRDTIELRGGEVLVGRIVLERGNYVEIELQAGCVVGFRQEQIAAIRKASVDPVAPVRAALPARDEWFLLHDGAGASIGSMHRTVSTDRNGLTQVLEEWEFAQGERTCQITSMCRADAGLRPVDCYFRERVIESALIGSPLDPMAKQQRVRVERIVEARVEGNRLSVSRLSPQGRTERTLPWPSDATFPQLLHELPLQSKSGQVVAATVFDPAVEDLRTTSLAGVRQRQAAIDGTVQLVDESVEQSADGRNVTWRDGSGSVLRREVSGPALVAVRCSPETARNEVGHRRVPAPFVTEAAGAFGLWVPNPAWTASVHEGSVALRIDSLDASIGLSKLGSLDAGASLDAAAHAVERWSSLTHPEMKVTSRSERSLRGVPAAQIETEGGVGADSRRARMVVVASDEGFLVLRCAAPSRSWDELDSDFEAVASRLERTAAAVAALAGKKPVPVVAAPTAETAPVVDVPAAQDVPANHDAHPAKDASMPKGQGRVLVPAQDGDGR